MNLLEFQFVIKMYIKKYIRSECAESDEGVEHDKYLMVIC